MQMRSQVASAFIAGALEDLSAAVQKGFMAGLPAAPGFAVPSNDLMHR